MKMTEPQDPLETAALLAQTGTCRGEKPDRAELRAWATHTLEAERREQVDSHIAHDPAVFEQAMRMLDDTRTVPPARGPRLALAATALVAFVGAVFLLDNSATLAPLEPTPDTMSVERSARRPASDWRSAAFLAGAARVAPFAPQSLNLQNCIDGEMCPQLALALYNYGRTLAELNAQCPGALRPTPAQIEALRNSYITFDKSFELAPWSLPVNQAIAGLPALDCATVQSLMKAPAGAQ